MTDQMTDTPDVPETGPETPNNSVAEPETPKSPEIEPMTLNVPDAEPDTYHSPKALIRLATIAEWISYLFLFLFLVVGGVIIYLIYLTIKGRVGVEQFFINLPNYLTPFFIGGFIWIFLLLASEAAYVLMDIEDNTRLK